MIKKKENTLLAFNRRRFFLNKAPKKSHITKERKFDYIKIKISVHIKMSKIKIN